MNKKGAEMTIGSIVMIILALVVLVVLIFGFTMGWSNLWQKITGLGGGDVNVQTNIDACNLACTANQEFDYCTKARSVIITEGADAETLTCKQLAERDIGLDACASITCPVVEPDA